MTSPIITLTTDFGTDSPYVAQMKGAILSVHRDVTLMDLCHRVAPQNIIQAAIILEDTCHCFPDETIHLIVVDPGVGTDRRIVCARLDGQHFIAPDNGVLTALVRQASRREFVAVENRAFWRESVSNTFHGRDIMGPVAAHLARGVDPKQLGPAIEDELVAVDLPEVSHHDDGVDGCVITCDRFGNLLTNIRAADLARSPSPAQVTVQCRRHRIRGVVNTYGERPAGSAIALIGSAGRLELAIVNGNAAAVWGAGPGDTVTVRWTHRPKQGERTE